MHAYTFVNLPLSPCQCQQMEELLKEVSLSERRKQLIDSFVQSVTEQLQTVPQTSEMEVCQ